MESKPGTYALLLQSRVNQSVAIGRWGTLAVRPGFYIYVGSAFGPGGVRSRVSRHCRKDKPQHWHIDALRQHTTPVCCWYTHTPKHLEHDWAAALAKINDTTPITGFGCTDCRCESHLFFTPVKPEFELFARAVPGNVKLWSCSAGTS